MENFEEMEHFEENAAQALTQHVCWNTYSNVQQIYLLFIQQVAMLYKMFFLSLCLKSRLKTV